MTAPKAPPREVWVVTSADGVLLTADDTAEAARRWQPCWRDTTVHRYVLAPARERERATADCLCREIDPSDRPCIVCASSDAQGILRPANAMRETEREVVAYAVRDEHEFYVGHEGVRVDDLAFAQRWPLEEHEDAKDEAKALRGRVVRLTRRVRRGP